MRTFQRLIMLRGHAVVVLLIAAVLSSDAIAADADNAWSHFPFGNDFNALEADGDILWVATSSGGVLEWDTLTNTARKYSQGTHCLPGNFVVDIAVDGVGDVWMATTTGVGRRPAGAAFDDPWDVFDSSNSPLPDNGITAVETGPDGTIWVGTFDHGLFHRDATRGWTVFNTANSPIGDNLVTSIKFDLAGNAWIGVWSAGVDRFDGTNWTNFDPGNTFPGGAAAPNCLKVDINNLPPNDVGLISVFVNVIGVDPQTGDMWFFNEDDGPCLLNGTTRFDGTNWSTYTNENSNAQQDRHDALIRDANGDLLFASIATFERFDGADWLPADASGNFVPGRDLALIGNDLWITGGNGALVRIRDGNQNEFTPPGPVDSAVWGVATITTQLPNEPRMERDAVAWIATRSGVQRFDGVNWITFDESNSGLPSNATRAVAQDLDGSLWFGSGFTTGVSRFDGQTWQSWSFDEGLFASRIYDIEVHPLTSEKWMVSDFGVVSRTFDGSSFINYRAGFSQLPGNASDLAIAPDGTIWITTNSGLVHIVDDESWLIMTEADGLPINHMFALDVDQQGNVWTGSNLGVSMFDGETWTTMQPAPKLPASANRVFEIVVAPNGDIWAAMLSQGVSRYDGQSWTHFNQMNDDLISDQVQGFDVNAQGEIWMGTFNGVMVFSGPGVPIDCPTDITGTDDTLPNGATDVFDLLELLANWGTNGNGSTIADPPNVIDVFDLLDLLANWGPCG